MEKMNLAPEQVWQKLLELEKARCAADKEEDRKKLRVGSLSSTFEDQQLELLQNTAEEPNAEKIYLFCLQKNRKEDISLVLEDELTSRMFFEDVLDSIAKAIVNKPYAENILKAIMEHHEFRAFDEDVQVFLLEKPALLEAYWQKGNDLSDEAELAIFAQPNWKEMLTTYLSHGFGLCDKAQKKLLALPNEDVLKLLALFISKITKKNYCEHCLCTNGLFFLLKNKPLFDLYVEKMSPFYKEEKYIFPQTIAFVAKRKGWL